MIVVIEKPLNCVPEICIHHFFKMPDGCYSDLPLAIQESGKVIYPEEMGLNVD
jgi:hypothetical protein